MDDERDREEFKHVCKLCNKRYPSGKSLGGHMRSHVVANSKLAQRNKAPPPPFVVADDDDKDEEDDADADEDENEIADQERENGGGYVLRENPRKTWRAVDSRRLINHKLHQNQQNQQQEVRICKHCGKGFQSLKALCGHMSSHSEKDRNFKVEDDHSWSSESHSDHHHHHQNPNYNNFDSAYSKRLTRSSISKHRQRQSPLSAGGNGGGSSSYNSEIDQLEQEEVAMCLMMLSRDSSAHKLCFNLAAMAAESSDNNSVILEGGSSSNHGVGIAKRKDLNLVGSDHYGKFKKVGVVGSGEKMNVALEMDNSDSGYFENGAKELESDDSNDGFLRNYHNHHGFNKPKVDSGSGLVNSYDDYSKKRVRDVGNAGFDGLESEEKSSKKIRRDNFQSSNPQKRSKLECLICYKTFESHQALASHVLSHRKPGENNLSTSNNTRNKPPQSYAPATNKAMPSNYAKKGSGSKKIKGHKCPYCPKVFKSGQALGGHKRSHMMGSGGGGGSSSGSGRPEWRSGSPAPPPESEQRLPIIDLNLPAPVEEEAGGSSHFEASW